jgi:LPPG:FO 2-phospho-L-lactate transferase
MDGLRELGVEIWFNLGDRDLAFGLQRAEALASGRRLTEAHADITRALGLQARVLPASDRPVRTHVFADGAWLPFQEFMIQRRAQGRIDDVDFRGVRSAEPTPEVLQAVADARAIVIGPSNPVASIAPILELPGMRVALQRSRAPVVGVSPLVQGSVIKGPTAQFMRWAGQPLSAQGIAQYYAGLIDGLVADERTDLVPVLETDMLMDTPVARRRLAEATLQFTNALT